MFIQVIDPSFDRALLLLVSLRDCICEFLFQWTSISQIARAASDKSCKKGQQCQIGRGEKHEGAREIVDDPSPADGTRFGLGSLIDLFHCRRQRCDRLTKRLIARFCARLFARPHNLLRQTTDRCRLRGFVSRPPERHSILERINEYTARKNQEPKDSGTSPPQQPLAVPR